MGIDFLNKETFVAEVERAASLSSAASRAEEKGPLQPLPESRLLMGREDATGINNLRDLRLLSSSRGNSLPIFSIVEHSESRATWEG